MPRVKGCVKEAEGKVAFGEYDLPDPGPGQALISTALTTVCGSDIHIVDDIPLVPAGTPMGHEAVGTVEAIGEGVERFSPGDRVVVSCLQSCGYCDHCRRGDRSVCTTFAAPANVLFGAQGEAFLVNGADGAMAHVPASIDDRAAIFCADILSTGFAAVERAGVSAGDSVAVFAQGPVGLCATMGARHYGAEPIIAVEGVPERQDAAGQFGATHVIEPDRAVEEIMELTGGTGVDVAVEALGRQVTFENCCGVTRLGGTVSSVGVYGGTDALSLPTGGGFAHRTIVTTLCPVGTDRLVELLDLIESGAVDPTPLFTHDRRLDEIVEAYDIFRAHADGVLKIAVT